VDSELVMIVSNISRGIGVSVRVARGAPPPSPEIIGGSLGGKA